MGFITHDAIVVTAFSKKYIEASHKKAVELFGTQVSDISEAAVNGYVSFFIPPDGSKEGWEESVVGNFRRAELVTFMREADSYVDFVEIRYGGDFGCDNTPLVTYHN